MAIVVGVLHPGEMGSSVGACASAAGADVCWASAGRSAASRARAEADGLRDVGGLATLVAEAGVIVSVCPPSEAAAVADSVFELGFAGTYVDANAVNPATARAMAEAAAGSGADFVDGGIVGPPARSPGSTVLYLSGAPSSGAPERIAGK